MPWSKTSSISLILLILWKKEPFAGKIKFSLVAGDLPPGIHIESDGKRIYGMAPDADTQYAFTIRATGSRGKYADAVFKMETLGKIS
jgi:hypothetical protein